jgi:IclR family transcriptional regulator, acetate operon repressor
VDKGAEPAGSGAQYRIRAVERVCDILEHLRAAPAGATLPEIAEVADLPKSSAFRYLVTFEARRLVERDEESGAFHLGLAFLLNQPHQVEILAAHVRPVLERLSDELGETVTFGILDGSHITYVEAVESRRAVRLAARNGGHDPIHSTAVGKAISSELPERRVREILAVEGMPRRTDSTITDVDSFLSDVADVRRRGYALEDAENEPDGWGIAVPMPRTPIPAAIGLSAPASRARLGDVEPIARTLRDASDHVADRLEVLR